jgi:hypothetical protein
MLGESHAPDVRPSPDVEPAADRRGPVGPQVTGCGIGFGIVKRVKGVHKLREGLSIRIKAPTGGETRGCPVNAISESIVLYLYSR